MPWSHSSLDTTPKAKDDEGMLIRKISVTPEGVARARRESMERAGVGASVTPELLKHAEEQGRKLRAKARTHRAC